MLSHGVVMMQAMGKFHLKMSVPLEKQKQCGPRGCCRLALVTGGMPTSLNFSDVPGSREFYLGSHPPLV